MALIACPECTRQISEKAIACPSCGYPIAATPRESGVAKVIGGVAGTYISANALVSMVLGVVMFTAFAAIMVALIVKG